jgi:hypothetical protein
VSGAYKEATVACTDGKHKIWSEVPDQKVYELQVDTAPGVGVLAQYDHPDTTTIEVWPTSDLVLGKKKVLDAPGKTHVVFVIISFLAAAQVTVRAALNGEAYCRTVTGDAGSQEIIIHTMVMK